MSESDKIISILRLYRSAQTPAKGDRKRFGRKLTIIEIVIIVPDAVDNVIYHVIAY